MWAIADCRNMSGGLERMLLEAGERVLRVPPKLMASQRKAARSFSKSDPIGALAVALAAIREPDLPAATLPGIAQEIGSLVDQRDDLVCDAGGHQRRLRRHLHEIDPDQLTRRARELERELLALVRSTHPDPAEHPRLRHPLRRDGVRRLVSPRHAALPFNPS